MNWIGNIFSYINIFGRNNTYFNKNTPHINNYILDKNEKDEDLYRISNDNVSFLIFKDNEFYINGVLKLDRQNVDYKDEDLYKL